MPDNNVSNGKPVTVPTNKAADKATDFERYRPKASTGAVHEEVMRSLSSVITTAVQEAGSFVSLAGHYDRDAGTAVRLGHLVDATECVEIAMTHLGQLKAAMSHRLRLEDQHYAGESPF